MRALLYTAIVVTAACGRSAAPPAPVEPTSTQAPAACLADRMPEALPAQDEALDCTNAVTTCSDACEKGVAVSCRSLAYVVERDPTRLAEALRLYERSCELGDLNGCTNFGSYLLHGDAGLAADPPCAARVHQRSCEGGETFGCGMFGTELARGDGVERDPVRAREVLERGCAELGGFACRALGWALQDGDLGSVNPRGAAAAFQRACETTDPGACPDAERLAEQP